MKEKDDKDREIEELRRDLRLMKLRRQVTPHFLFNSLSVAVSLVITSPKEAVAFLRRIAEMYRYLLNYGDEYTVPIEKELVMMRQYFDLMSTRHVDCLELHVSREVRRLKGYPLPPLALQGLVENAIKHNVHTPEKRLKINLSTDGDWLIVSNNRLPLVSDGGSTHMGLAYMDETMLLLFHRNIRVESDDKHFTVRLPLIPPNEVPTTQSLRP
ncbi:MAG: histidine kinase [Prevotella sp.]|jgi:LytS/YehU family sensor histidine kinase|nr:histidine kinase [Prevotella sp.]MDY6241480.1 histidine kinase [Prevotella sp.]